MNNTQFFNYTTIFPIGNKKFRCYTGVEWSSIERYYTNPDGSLSLVLKSMTEGYKDSIQQVQQGKRIVEKKTQIKVPLNSMVSVTEPEEVEKFFAHLGVERLPELVVDPELEDKVPDAPGDTPENTTL